MITFKLSPSASTSNGDSSDHIYIVPTQPDSTDILPTISNLIGPSRYQERNQDSTSTPCQVMKAFESYSLTRNTFNKSFSHHTSYMEDSSARKGRRLASELEKTKSALYAFENKGQGKYASFYAVFFIESSFRERDYKTINDLLSEIETEHISEWSLVALLRSSFSAKDYLPAWSVLLSAAKKKLENEGKDTKQYLRGLAR